MNAKDERPAFRIQRQIDEEKLVKMEQMEVVLKQALRSNLYCAESVVLAVAEGLNIRSPLIPRIASGFCSGLSRTGGTCGAVNGGIMALGLLFGRDDGEGPPDGAYDKVRTFLQRFSDAHGSCTCLELTGCDLSTEEGRNRYAEEGMMVKCYGLTRDAVSLVAEIAQG